MPVYCRNVVGRIVSLLPARAGSNPRPPAAGRCLVHVGCTAPLALYCSRVCGCAATDVLRDAASSSRSQHPSSCTWLRSCLACNSVSGCVRESPGSAPRVVTQLVTHQPGGRGTESLVGTAPAAPPPASAMRAGLGGGVPTGAVAATRALHVFGTVVLGAHSGREQGVVQVPRIGRSRVELERHANLRRITGALPDKTRSARTNQRCLMMTFQGLTAS